jgi:hypothetical protein
MKESVTSQAGAPALLERKEARRLLEVLAGPRDITHPRKLDMAYWSDPPAYRTDRDRIEIMLELVNDSFLLDAYGSGLIVPRERVDALRAFLQERVAIREREALIYQVSETKGEEHTPQRTVALNEAAVALPGLLNGRVTKTIVFSNRGEGRRAHGYVNNKPADITIEGVGGELGITERLKCDCPETALNYALAQCLNKAREFGRNLCRCHADGCGRFWLVPESLPGKPSRNYCERHVDDRIRLGNAERKRRQREK